MEPERSLPETRQSHASIGIQHPIFVYGTLMSGERAYYLHAGSIIRIGLGRLANADLYSLGQYPMALFGSGLVLGEVHWLAEGDYENTLLRLDNYEGTQYSRELRTIALEPDRTGVHAWVYMGRRRPLSSSLIEDGDWRAWRERHLK